MTVTRFAPSPTGLLHVGILRTAVQQNQGNVGVYAAVVQGRHDSPGRSGEAWRLTSSKASQQVNLYKNGVR